MFEIYTTDLLGGHADESGTSMAAPHVAGVATLLIHRGVADVRNALLSTAIDLGPEGFDTLYGYGLVSAAGAVMIPAPPAAGLTLPGVSLVHGRRRSAMRENERNSVT